MYQTWCANDIVVYFKNSVITFFYILKKILTIFTFENLPSFYDLPPFLHASKFY